MPEMSKKLWLYNVLYTFSCKQVSYQSPICEKNDCIFSSYILGVMDKKIFDILGCFCPGNKKLLYRFMLKKDLSIA